jgi:hypothetical protein
MPRNHNEPEKSSKLPTRTDGKRQNEDRKAIPRQQNSNNAGSSQQSTEKSNKSTDGHFGNKKVIPPIGFNRREESKDDDNNEQDFEIIDKGSLPLKLFDGKKQSLNELSEESMSYLWLRRIKEIFLHMADGKDEEEEDDPFIEFNMNLARTDLTNTCDRYIENERLALKKKVRFINSKLIHTATVSIHRIQVLRPRQRPVKKVVQHRVCKIALKNSTN